MSVFDDYINKKKSSGYEDFFTVNQDYTLTYTARVRYAFPWLNLYVVEPVYTGSGPHTLFLAAGSDNTTHTGSIIQAYDVGSYVMIHSDKATHGSMSLTDYIVGYATVPNNESVDDTPTDGPTSAVAPFSAIRNVISSISDRLKRMCGALEINAPKRFNSPTDILSGDINMMSSPNTGVSSLKHLVRIQCGRGCFIELDSILSRIRVVTTNMEYVGPLKHYTDMSGHGTLMEYNRTAVSFKEGTRGATEDDYSLQAMFRKTDVSGDMVSGWQTSVSVPSAINNNSDDVYTTRVRYDGEALMVSAKGFEIRKSLNIDTPYQIEEVGGISNIIKEVDEFPELVNNYTSADADKLMTRDMDKWSEHDARKQSDYPRVAVNSDNWKLSGDNNTYEMSSAAADERNRSLDNIGDKQYYDLPDTVTLTDPRTGKTYTYFKSTSGFRQDPDGSLVLYDGYGSEIRMTRGSIIISSAADTIIRPGRDLHTMAGRHTAIVSHEDVTIHSSTTDVNIKGQHDVSVLAGVNSDGGILLDDRGERGMLLRAKSNASVVGKDVFVGSLPETYPTTFVGASEGSGRVTIGGGLSTTILGKTIAMSGESIDTIARQDKEVSWVSVDSSRITSISKNINMSGDVYIGQVSGILMANIGNTRLTVGNRSSTSTLKVATAVEVAYGISCKQLWADQVIGVRAGFGNAYSESGLRSSVESPKVNVTAIPLTQSNHIYAVYSGPWMDSFNMGYQFKYRDSKELGIDPNYTIHGMLWQTYLKGGTVWSEDTIPGLRTSDDGSMVYPGKEAWEGSFVYGTDSKITINGGYIINGRG